MHVQLNVAVWEAQGKQFVEVARDDRPYCAWVLADGGPAFARFKSYLRRVHGGVLMVGKHKGLFFDEILHNNPEYCRWAMALTNPSQSLSGLIDYLVEKPISPPPLCDKGQHEEESASPLLKHRRLDFDMHECKVCNDGDADHAIIPCGHIVCAVCVNRICGTCPFCRAPTHQHVKLFVP